jgi:hypothetical protein
VDEWTRRELSELVWLYAESGRISADQAAWAARLLEADEPCAVFEILFETIEE